MKYSLGYSTCPNDTFIFGALACKKIDCGSYDFDISLMDVEKLNRLAEEAYFDISKLSFAAIGKLRDKYGLLRSGSALGRGCGPLVIARDALSIEKLKASRIAIPGDMTTANMLLGLHSGSLVETVPMVFDEIMPAVRKGHVDAGVIIHESRFTYENYGLKKIVDLGEWWEKETGHPIPLGGIAVRRDTPFDTAREIDSLIETSIKYAFGNRSENDPYILKHAMEMEPEVIRQHIDLYVNKFSINIGDEGEAAIRHLFSMAEEKGLIMKSDQDIFAY